MESGAPRVGRGDGVFEDGVGAVRDEVAVVVPHDDVLVPISGGVHRRPEVVLQEISLLLSRVDARLPALYRHGLILDGHPPHGQPFCLIGFDELHEVLGPGVPVFRQQ